MKIVNPHGDNICQGLIIEWLLLARSKTGRDANLEAAVVPLRSVVMPIWNLCQNKQILLVASLAAAAASVRRCSWWSKQSDELSSLDPAACIACSTVLFASFAAASF